MDSVTSYVFKELRKYYHKDMEELLKSASRGTTHNSVAEELSQLDIQKETLCVAVSDPMKTIRSQWVTKSCFPDLLMGISNSGTPPHLPTFSMFVGDLRMSW